MKGWMPMFINPKKVAFETKDDIIDYVSGGFLPPRQSHFDKVINKVRNPNDSLDPTLECKRGREVVIDDTVIPEGDREVLADVLTRVYGNRIEKRDIILTVAGIGMIAAVIYSLFTSGEKESATQPDYLESSIWDLPKGEYVDKNGNKLTVF